MARKLRKDLKDLTGLRVGKLVVEGPCLETNGMHRKWIARCLCGRTKAARSYTLRNGMVTMCAHCHAQETSSRQKKLSRLLPDGRRLLDVASELGLSPEALRRRIDVYGWSVEDAIVKPRRNYPLRRGVVGVPVFIQSFPCCLCGTPKAVDYVKPWRSRGPCCRECFVAWDREQEQLEYLVDYSLSKLGEAQALEGEEQCPRLHNDSLTTTSPARTKAWTSIEFSSCSTLLIHASNTPSRSCSLPAVVV